MRKAIQRFLAAVLCLTACCVSGAVVTWTGNAGDGQWFTAGNWDTGVSPGNAFSDDVIIQEGEVLYTPGGDFSPTGSLTIGASAGFTQVEGAAWPNIKGVLNVYGTLDWGTAGAIRYGDGAAVTVYAGGRIVNRETAQSTVANSVLSVDGGTVTFVKSAQWNSGDFTVRNGGVLDCAGTLRIGPTATMLLTNATANVYTFQLQAGGGMKVFHSTLTITNTMTVASGSSLLLGEGAVLNRLGNLLFSDNVVLDGGKINLDGEFQWNSNTTLSGDVVCKIMACQAAGSRLTLQSGSVTTRSSSYNGFYVAGGSVDFEYGSKAKLNLFGIDPASVYSKYFSNGSITYRAATVTEEEFSKLFTVESVDIDGIGTCASIYLTEVEEGTAQWDGMASVTEINSLSATVEGTLQDAGTSGGDVYLYYGKTYGGTIPESWEHSLYLGQAAGGQSYTATLDLQPGSVYSFGLAVVTASGEAVWAAFPQRAYLAADYVNTFLGSVGSDGSNGANWSLGIAPTASHTVFITPDVSQSDLLWSSNMTQIIAGWHQPEVSAGRSLLVTFQTTPEQPLEVTGDVVFEMGTWVHDGPSENPTHAFAMHVCGNMRIGANAQINAGNGVANAAAGKPRGYRLAGPGFVATSGSYEEGTLVCNLGASHGGEAGANGVTYGSILNPLSYGSSGNGDSAISYSGAGVIVLMVDGELVLDGDISADGFAWDAAAACQGGSAGGSVNIEAGSLTGGGAISADGGSAPTNSGSGAGGRIRCKVGTDSFTGFTGRITAFGGAGSETGWETAGAGTILLQTALDDAVSGTLRIENRDVFTGQNDVTRYTAIPSSDHSNEELNKVMVELASTARVRMTSNCVLGAVAAVNGAQMQIEKDVLVRTPSLTLDGSVYGTGLYSAAELPEFLTGDGVLEITCMQTLILFH